MTTVWKKAVEAVEVGEDTGDILAPLGRIYDKYIAHANRLINRADKQKRGMTQKETRGFMYYTESSVKVLALINQ